MPTRPAECQLCSETLEGTERIACHKCLDELYHISRADGSCKPTGSTALRRHLMRLRVCRELRELEDIAA